MTSAALVLCEVSTPEHHAGDVLAELNRIGGWIRDMQHNDSTIVYKVGVSHDNVILFEKWLAKRFHGEVKSLLLPDDGDA